MKFFYFSIILLFLVGCQKDKAIKNKFSSGKGSWEIVKYERFLWDPLGTNPNRVYWCNNCGEMKFNKDSGEIILNYQAKQFDYSISNEKLIMYFDDEGIGYYVTWNWNKSEFTLTSNIGAAGFSEVITCKKIK